MRRYTERRSDNFRRSQDESQSVGKIICLKSDGFISSKTQIQQRGKIQPLKTVELSEYQKNYYQIYMYKPHTPCKLQRWSSAQSASSGLFDPSASSVHCLTGSLHAHVFPKMLRIPALHHSGRFVCSVSPCVSN